MNRRVPPVLWIALVSLVSISLIQLCVGLVNNQPSLQIAVAVQLSLVFGLYAGHRWAYVALMVLTALSIVTFFLKDPHMGMFVLLIDSVVTVPVLLSTSYFFEARSDRDRFDPLRYPGCGYSLLGITEPRCPECGREFRMPGG